MKYSEKEKNLIIESYKNGMPYKEICSMYNIPSSTLFSWLQKYKIQSQKEKRLSHTAKEYYKLNCLFEKAIRKNNILNDSLTLYNITLKEKLIISEILLKKYKLKEITKILHISTSTLFHLIHDKVEMKKI